MDLLFSIAMLLAGLILIFSLSKENKIFYVAGGYFVLLGLWSLVNNLSPDLELFSGAWGLAFRCLTGAVLVVLVVVFAREYRKKGRDAQEQNPKDSSHKGDF